MRVPLSWLRNYVQFDLPANELAHRLTMAGNEVGDVEIIGAELDPERLVVGYVLSVDPHPNADRLMLPTVDIGNGETATVVCGAPNVAAGQKIAFAMEGAMLINPRSGKPDALKAATIRGVRSAGMVCSPLELGLSDDHEGILVLDDDAPSACLSPSTSATPSLMSKSRLTAPIVSPSSASPTRSQPSPAGLSPSRTYPTPKTTRP